MKSFRPVFLYTSTCCNAMAEKDPCIKTKDNDQLPLGTWNCSHCRKKCKVTRSLNPDMRNNKSK